MKAVVYRQNTGLSCEEAPAPVLAEGQVLIKVSNTGFCGSDHSMVQGGFLPDGYILGHEISGTVVEHGPGADAPPLGSRVIIRPTYCGACPDCLAGKQQFCQNNRRTTGIGDLPGAFAEYLAAYPQMCIPIPDGVDSRNAALAEAFATCLHGINCTGKTGGSVLVMGGGAIGLAMVRLLKIMGFGPIVLSEPVEFKRAKGLEWGADAALNPLEENLGEYVLGHTAGLGFQTVFECSGVGSNLQAGLDAAARFGTMCVTSVIYKEAPITPFTLVFKEVWLTGCYGNTHAENKQCLQWMAEGALDARPLITDLATLEELPRVYAERIHTGQALKVLLRIGEEF